ncbi:unnamed protein product [Heterobilharzia americana]|nr:unnamed protein product [Heterobilharzia americana]
MHPNDKNNRYLPTGNQCTPQTYGNRRRFFSHSSRLLTRNRGYSHCEANGFDNELEHCNNHGMYFRRGRLYQRNNRWITNRGASSSFTRDSNHRRPTYSDNQTVVGSKPNLQSTTNSVGPSCSVQDSYSESVISSRALQSSIVTLRSPKSECQDDLRSNLIDGLRNNTYQCMICISKIRSTDPIWSCTTCYHIYHLLCIKSWAKKSSQKDNIEATVTHEWRCPSCQANYDVPSELISYQCFCGRTRNPEFHPARVTIPHSCDQLCGKVKRIPSTSVLTNALVDGYQCTHLCTEICHPGPCPPCLAAVTLKCPCGKVQRSGTCGDPHLQPCGQICGRQLSSPLCAVGFHMCLSLCHYGPCPPCRWLIQTACFCGRMDKKLTCGNNNDIKKCIFSSEDLEILRTAVIELQNTIKSIDYTNNIDNLHNMSLEDDSLRAENNFDNRLTLYLSSIDSNNTSHSNVNTMIKFNDEQIISFDILFIKIGPTFSCDQLCDRLLNCTHHNCSNYCHSEKCPPCLLDPKWCLNCPCGKTPLSKLVPSGSLNGDRKSCIDPIPTCPNLCGRPRSLCGHPCSEYCHTGSCPPCKLSIHLKCRCGYSSKMVTCHEFSELSEKEGGAAELCCERICKKRLVCGRHKCQTKCCNVSNFQVLFFMNEIHI